MDPIQTVQEFNTRINEQDLEGLVALMTEEHVFIDSAGANLVGRDRCRQAWRDFFGAFPDYRNHLESATVRHDTVLVQGRSSCTDSRLAGRAIWTATVRDDLVAEWRVYDDTPETRRLLGWARSP